MFTNELVNHPLPARLPESFVISWFGYIDTARHAARGECPASGWNSVCYIWKERGQYISSTVSPVLQFDPG